MKLSYTFLDVQECFKLEKNSKDWKETVKHARKCDLEGNCNLKSYRVEEKHVVLFFNCVHDLVGAQFHDGYVTKDNFNSDQQVYIGICILLPIQTLTCELRTVRAISISGCRELFEKTSV